MLASEGDVGYVGEERGGGVGSRWEGLVNVQRFWRLGLKVSTSF